MIPLHIDRLNTLRFCGINRILGVELSRDGARVVELKSSGGIANKFNATYRAVKCFKIHFPDPSTAAGRGAILAEELRNRKIGTRLCVAAIGSQNSRTVEADVPADVDDVRTWVGENFEQLIRVPIPFNDLAFAVRVVSVGQDSTRCEIALVRATERDEAVQLLESAGLSLLGLEFGSKIAEAAALIDGSGLREKRSAFVFAGENETIFRIYDGGELGPWNKLPNASLTEELFPLNPDLAEIVVAGPNAEMVQGDKTRVLRPLGLHPEYAIAVGLGVRGFLPETGLFDLTPDVVRKRSTEVIDKSLLKRALLVFASLLFLLLAGHYAIGSYLRMESTKLEEKVSAISPVYSRVTTLRKQVTNLKRELGNRFSAERRSHVSKALQEIAEATPRGVWLYRLVTVEQRTGALSIELRGYAGGNREAASYLTSLQKNPHFTNVEIIRVGTPTETELAAFTLARMRSFTTFHVKLSTSL